MRILSVIAALLIVLKLAGVIAWSWWIVLVPVWLLIGAAGVMISTVVVAWYALKASGWR